MSKKLDINMILNYILHIHIINSSFLCLFFGMKLLFIIKMKYGR